MPADFQIRALAVAAFQYSHPEGFAVSDTFQLNAWKK